MGKNLLQESSQHPGLVRTPSLLSILPMAAEVEDLTTLLCRRELWMGTERTTITGVVTVMVKFCYCIIAAFDQQSQATVLPWKVLGMAGTSYSQTWMRAEVAPGRD